jgi:hypothetical protein
MLVWVEGWMALGRRKKRKKKKKKAIEIPLSLLRLLLFAHVELAEGVSIFFFFSA